MALNRGNPLFVKNLAGFSAFGLFVFLTLGGCVTSVNNPAGVAHAEQEKLVVAGLSEELIYEYLVGDIAARRGDSVPPPRRWPGR